MKTFNVLFASGKMTVIKADEYEFSLINGVIQVVFRVKGYGITVRVNWEYVECIEEVIIDE